MYCVQLHYPTLIRIVGVYVSLFVAQTVVDSIPPGSGEIKIIEWND